MILVASRLLKFCPLQITKIPTELNICGDHGYTSRNKMPKVPIDPMCANKLLKVKGQNYRFFKFFSKMESFLKI